MKFKILLHISILFVSLVLLLCKAEIPEIRIPPEEKKRLKKYWYQGKAEINRYSLEQFRYGSLHKGDALMIFVTEDFLTDAKVKNETYTQKNSIPVLKLNFNRKFTTGIYDYSTMISVFTPVALNKYSASQKVSLSSQEWCGHVYSHLLLSDSRKFKLTSHSYFEREVHENYYIKKTLLEDEIFNRIRLSPESLPKGKLEVIPSLLDSRLRHFKLEPSRAFIKSYPNQDKSFKGKDLIVYEVNYTTLERTLKIIYEKNFPRRIKGFIETYSSKAEGIKHRTKAVLTHSIFSPYWNQNQPKDRSLRKKLGL